MSQDNRLLLEWIDAATAGLPPSAAGKFHAEIADHFAEARARHVEAGLSPDEAGRAALADLGDAGQVARTFRDAHFSRGAYRWGGLALLALGALFAGGISLVLPLTVADPSRLLDALSGMLIWHLIPSDSGLGGPLTVEAGVAQVVVIAALAVLFLAAVRAALILLREQHDLPLPRRGWAVLVAAVAAWAAPVTLIEPLRWLVETLSPTLGDTLSGLWSISPTLGLLGGFAIGPLLAVFCAGRLVERRAAARGAFGVLMALGVLVGLEMMLGYLAAGHVAISYDLYRLEFYTGLDHNALAVGYLMPFLSLQMTLFGIFAHMRRPGAALAG